MSINRNKTKSIITIFVALITIVSMLAGCTNTAKNKEKTIVNIATIKGPTGMGMVKLLDDNEKNVTTNKYNTTIVGAPDEIVGKISSGELDIAAVPTNLAATLYNKTNGNVQLLALNTLGVLYILENGSTIKQIGDLKDKTLYASGKGSTPEFIINYLLSENGIDPEKDINIIYKSEHSELATLALSGQADIIMIPEPFVTNILSKNAGFNSVIDLTKEWTATTEGSGIKNSVLSMGGVIVRKEFAKENPDAVNAFLDEYSESVKFTNESLDLAAQLVEKYEIMPSAALAKQAIPNCNIVFVEGQEMKNQISNLYDVFFTADPKSVGGKIPDEDFYYTRISN